ncbi:MAG: hypothetical protein LBC86_06640 [Oscillospiraceae bacterium]|nr:hypothetical protein [Oscillospiraceae bacterium]
MKKGLNENMNLLNALFEPVASNEVIEAIKNLNNQKMLHFIALNNECSLEVRSLAMKAIADKEIKDAACLEIFGEHDSDPDTCICKHCGHEHLWEFGANPRTAGGHAIEPEWFRYCKICKQKEIKSGDTYHKVSS